MVLPSFEFFVSICVWSQRHVVAAIITSVFAWSKVAFDAVLPVSVSLGAFLCPNQLVLNFLSPSELFINFSLSFHLLIYSFLFSNPELFLNSLLLSNPSQVHLFFSFLLQFNKLCLSFLFHDSLFFSFLF